MADIEIKGLSKLLQAMEKLPKVVEDKCIRTSMVPGAQIIRDAAQSLAVRRTGLMSKAIHIAFNKKESGTNKKVYHVFVSRRVKQVYPKGKIFGRTDRYAGKLLDPFYWHFIEFGTVKMAAKPFMRPAFDSTSGKALNEIINNLKRTIEIEATALGR